MGVRTGPSLMGWWPLSTGSTARDNRLRWETMALVGGDQYGDGTIFRAPTREIQSADWSNMHRTWVNSAWVCAFTSERTATFITFRYWSNNHGRVTTDCLIPTSTLALKSIYELFGDNLLRLALSYRMDHCCAQNQLFSSIELNWN